MKIAITGANGVVGTVVVAHALARGDHVVSIDQTEPAQPLDGVAHVTANMLDYDALLAAFKGCDALIHLAALPKPFDYPDHVVHNNNVVGSYNAMRAAIERGIERICQASSVNSIGLSYSRAPRFDYFPLDEHHATYAEEPYGLSKWICEQQADAFARRYSDLSIASLRFHWVVPDRETAAANFNRTLPGLAKHLWAYTQRDAAARACLLALAGNFTGHEVLYIVAPNTTEVRPSQELAAEHFPNTPIRGDLSGTRSFFDSSKAERLLGWRHSED